MEAVHIKIHGIVQGVGFRPFVHRLVREHGLAGSIRNTSSGVELELEGERAALEAFVRSLPERAPRLALIEQIETEYGLPPRGLTGFQILRSHAEEKRNTLVSPDIGICADCRRELTGAGAIPSSTAPTAGPASPSSGTCPMTGP